MKPRANFHYVNRFYLLYNKKQVGKILRIHPKPLFEAGVVFHNFYVSFFSLFLTISLKRMGLMIWLAAYLDIVPYIPPNCEPLGTHLGPLGGAPMAQKYPRTT
jgi:hypothetical protein